MRKYNLSGLEKFLSGRQDSNEWVSLAIVICNLVVAYNYKELTLIIVLPHHQYYCIRPWWVLFLFTFFFLLIPFQTSFFHSCVRSTYINIASFIWRWFSLILNFISNYCDPTQLKHDIIKHFLRNNHLLLWTELS